MTGQESGSRWRQYDGLLKTETGLTFLNLGNPTGLKFVVDHGDCRALFEMGIEHAPGAVPFSLGLRPRAGRELADLMGVGMAPRGTGVLEGWDGRTSLFVSHLHLDHVALVRWVHPDVPLHYPAAMEPLRAACVRAGYLGWRDPPGVPVPDRGRVSLGEIEVEFVAVDHDLPGASGFLVRMPDLTLAYTGDHRWHGARPELTAGFASAAQHADVLVQEAVSLGSDPPPEGFPERTEEDVIRGFAGLLDRARGLVVVNLYPMNRLRVRALGAACEARGRMLLMAPAAAAMADWPLVLESPEAVRHRPERYCVQVDFESLPVLLDMRPPPGSLFVLSNGSPLGPYDPAYRVMLAWLDALGLELVSLGSSGHSHLADLRRMVEAVSPRVVLPVHTRRPEALEVPGFRTLLAQPGRRYTAGELLEAGAASR